MADETHGGMKGAPVSTPTPSGGVRGVSSRRPTDGDAPPPDHKEYEESLAMTGRAIRGWLAKRRKIK